MQDTGNFQKDVESIIITHATDETGGLVPPRVNSATLEILLSNIYPPKEVRKALLERYPPAGAKPSALTWFKFKNEGERFRDFAADHAFNCHIRGIAMAYQDKAKVYLGQYSRGAGRHGDDIFPTFFNGAASDPKSLQSILSEFNDPGFGDFARTFQSYLLSHARTGNLNSLKAQNAMDWPTFKAGPIFDDVLDAGSKGYQLIKDNFTTAESCNLFFKVWADATAQGGKLIPVNSVYPA
jgi:carboxylesterase type B